MSSESDPRPAEAPETARARQAASAPLDAEAMAEMHAHGEVVDVEQGDVLFRAGDDSYDCFVVLDADVEVFRPSISAGDTTIAVASSGRFIGELSMLTGQKPYLSARMVESGQVLRVPIQEFHKVMANRPHVADQIFTTLSARQLDLALLGADEAIRIIGSRFSPDAVALQAFATRSHVVHSWLDLEDVEDPDVSLAALGLRRSDTPAVITPTSVLRRATPGDFAADLGLTYRPIPGFTFDLVVVGSGPSGLSASVYGASEGLSTMAVEAVATGGQAGASSRIENYVGFPNGISGEELVTRAAIQAQRLGARLNSPCVATGLRVEPTFHVVTLSDGSEIPCRSVIIASGARYRRLDVEDLERFEGAGVYYAATEMEARICATEPVIVVGGGNSAGQAALFLAEQGSRVRIAIRRDDLAATMSRYLIDRIDADPNIEVHAGTEVRGVHGDGHLERVTIEHTARGDRHTVPCVGLFCFIGAEAASGWLDGCIQLDSAGFVLTDHDLPESVTSRPDYAGRDPLPFETSMPGIFAVGDVRSGSMKRVAAAVGEGSSAVRSVHRHLATVL